MVTRLKYCRFFKEFPQGFVEAFINYILYCIIYENTDIWNT